MQGSLAAGTPSRQQERSPHERAHHPEHKGRKQFDDRQHEQSDQPGDHEGGHSQLRVLRGRPRVELTAVAPERVQLLEVVLRVLPAAEPAELVLAFEAGHVVAPRELLDRRPAARARLDRVLLQCFPVGFIQRVLI